MASESLLKWRMETRKLAFSIRQQHLIVMYTNSSLVNTILCFDEELSDVFVLNRGAPNNIVVAHCKVTSDMHAIIAEFNVQPHSCSQLYDIVQC